MRSLISVALLASVIGPVAGPAVAADLDDPPPPPPYYAPHPVPPAFVPGPVPPVYYRVPRPRPIIYPRPYPVYGPPPVVRVYGEPRPYAYGAAPRPYGEPLARPYDPREAEVYHHERDGYGAREVDRRDPHYGHYLSPEELDRRAARERGDDRFAERDRGYGRERDYDRDRYADRAPPRDYDR